MKKQISLALLGLSLAISQSSALAEEVALGKTIESRFTVALSANSDAAQAMLPEGWKLLTLGKGPLAGANTFIVFMNKHLQLDAEGKPKPEPAVRSVAVVNYAVQPEKPPRLYVTKTFEMGAMLNPYGNSVAASIEHKHSLEQAEGTTHQTENWVVKTADGGALKVDASFVKGVPFWGPGEALPYSSENADYHRLYRYTQLAEVASSKAMGKPLNGELSLESDLPELAKLLDGSQEVVGVMNIPIYIRDIFEVR